MFFVFCFVLFRVSCVCVCVCVLFPLVLFCFVLSHFASSSFALSSFVLSCFVCLVLVCFVSFRVVRSPYVSFVCNLSYCLVWPRLASFRFFFVSFSHLVSFCLGFLDEYFDSFSSVLCCRVLRAVGSFVVWNVFVPKLCFNVLFFECFVMK